MRLQQRCWSLKRAGAPTFIRAPGIASAGEGLYAKPHAAVHGAHPGVEAADVVDVLTAVGDDGEGGATVIVPPVIAPVVDELLVPVVVPPPAQLPEEQIWPLAHAWPQAPQFVGSLSVSTQPPLHADSSAAQLSLHAPREQTWGATHAVLHPPQFAALLPRSTRPVPHSVSPA